MDICLRHVEVVIRDRFSSLMYVVKKGGRRKKLTM